MMYHRLSAVRRLQRFSLLSQLLYSSRHIATCRTLAQVSRVCGDREVRVIEPVNLFPSRVGGTAVEVATDNEINSRHAGKSKHSVRTAAQFRQHTYLDSQRALRNLLIQVNARKHCYWSVEARLHDERKQE